MSGADEKCTCPECDIYNRDALWRRVDRQWSERWARDQRAYERQYAELVEMLTAATDMAMQRGKRIDELERWQKVDLENYKRHLAELTEQLRLANIDAFNLAAELGDDG